MRVLSRAEWGGPSVVGSALRRQPVGIVVVHHSASPPLPKDATFQAEAAQVRAWHEFHRRPVHQDGRGWAGIAYNFIIFPSGRVYEGRGWGRQGAHAGAQANAVSVGICFATDGRHHPPTFDAMGSFADLRRLGVARGSLDRWHHIEPHSHYMSTECPGPRIMAVLDALREPVFATPTSRPILRHGVRSEVVRDLQRRLGMPARLHTGYFGDITDGRVREFQRAAGITVDGIVGPQTWAALLAR